MSTVYDLGNTMIWTVFFVAIIAVSVFVLWSHYRQERSRSPEHKRTWEEKVNRRFGPYWVNRQTGHVYQGEGMPPEEQLMSPGELGKLP